jgi:hypothetical protein
MTNRQKAHFFWEVRRYWDWYPNTFWAGAHDSWWSYNSLIKKKEFDWEPYEVWWWIRKHPSTAWNKTKRDMLAAIFKFLTLFFFCGGMRQKGLFWRKRIQFCEYLEDRARYYEGLDENA